MPRLLLACLLFFLPGLCPALELSMPLDCSGADLCFVQNYFDHDPGPAYADYRCGLLSYDGHTGTDVRVSHDDMREGVPVLAAAAGTVVGLRDGMEDVSVREGGREAVKGREAGNGVRIDHGGGWVTQYSHMRNGSVAVQMGQRVEQGQYLGLVGLSGMTEFPHLELTVRKDGKPLDPFTGQGEDQLCGQAADSLFAAAVANRFAYSPSGGVDAGFKDREPDLSRVLEEPSRKVLPPEAGALVFWAAFFGVRTGDEVFLKLTGPGEEVLVSRRFELPKDQAQRLQFIGKKSGAAPWPSGIYSGEAVLVRSGRELARMRRQVAVR